jgi:hypothetical protein
VRRFFLLIFIPVLILLGTIALSRALATRHYVVSGAPGDVLYAAAFDGLEDEWDIYDDGQLSAKVQDSALRLADIISPGSPISLAAPYFADFDLQAQARAVEGSLNNAFGVMFRYQESDRSYPVTWGGVINSTIDDLLLGAPQPKSYYLFLVSSDGYYQVKRVLNGTDEKILNAWTESSVVNQGLDAVNTLRVTARGGQFRFAVNGQPVQLCIPDNP